MKRILLVALSLSVLNACKSNSLVERSPQGNQDFINETLTLIQNFSNPQVLNPDTCVPYLRSFSQRIVNSTGADFAPQNENERTDLLRRGPEILKILFNGRVEIRHRLKAFEEQGRASKDCVQAIRAVQRDLRNAEEFLIEWTFAQGSEYFPPIPPNILDKSFPHTVNNPNYIDTKIKTGDVFLIRGHRYVSAMIARIGDEAAQFSHLALVGEDTKGQQYVVESLIHLGLTVTPLKKFLAAEEARLVHYRQADEALGKKAGRIMYDMAAKKGGGVHYDFAMDTKSYDSLFCSEVIRAGYDLASKGAFLYPAYMTTAYKFRGTDFMKDMGIVSEELVAPGDVEVDTRFELIAEYRKYPMLRKIRAQDAAMGSIYDWMINKNYDFRWTLPLSGKALLAKIIRQFGLAEDVLPKYMPMNTLATTVKFEALSKAMEKYIFAKEEAYFKQHKYSYTLAEMMALNEEYRKKDCQTYRTFLEKTRERGEGDTRNYNVSDFHYFYNTNDKTAPCPL